MELFNKAGKKVKDYFYPPTSLRLPLEQEVIKNSKQSSLPDKPAPALRPQSDYNADYKGPRDVAYTMESIKRPEDLYVEQYGKYKEIGEQNLRSAMVARRKAMYNLLKKYPQSRFADKNVDQQILNSRFLPVVDPAFGQKEADYIRDYYRAGGDYSRPVALVQSHNRAPFGVAHVSPWSIPSLRTTKENLVTTSRQIFPGLEERRLKWGELLGAPSTIINPTQEKIYGQSLVMHKRPSVTSYLMADVMSGVDIGQDPTEADAKAANANSQFDSKLREAVQTRNVVKPVRRHEIGHAGAPYFNVFGPKYPLFSKLQVSDVAPRSVMLKQKAEVSEALQYLLGDKLSKITPDNMRDKLTDVVVATNRPGHIRGAYFNNPAEAMTTFNQWKSNYARETGRPKPASLQKLIEEEHERGAIVGPYGNYRTVPGVMYSTGHTNDWASGINGILQIRNAVHKAVERGELSKEEAESIYKRMNELYLQGNRRGVGTSPNSRRYEYA